MIAKSDDKKYRKWELDVEGNAVFPKQLSLEGKFRKSIGIKVTLFDELYRIIYDLGGLSENFKKKILCSKTAWNRFRSIFSSQ